jgi:hypothetical protein
VHERKRAVAHEVQPCEFGAQEIIIAPVGLTIEEYSRKVVLRLRLRGAA